MNASDTVYDVIGLGFGPANLAIAGAILDKYSAPASSGAAAASCAKNVLFIEKHPVFKWHPGMLLPDTRMQISYLKDLATLRSPQSPLTFLSYLHSQGRLLPFINRGASTPSRREYSDYLSWAAQYVQDRGINVQYGEEVIGIKEADDDTVEVTSRRIEGGETFTRRARNLIVSPGGQAKFPTAISIALPHPRILHSSVYAYSIDNILPSVLNRPDQERPIRIAIIGSGQSSSEVLLDLHRRLSGAGHRDCELDLIFRKGSLKPSDDSPFANEIFDPDTTDMVYNLPSQRVRREVLNEYHNTNYGVVNPRTIDALYELMYDQKLDDAVSRRHGQTINGVRVSMQPYTDILSADDASTAHPGDHAEPSSTDRASPAVRLTLQNVLDKSIREKTYDIVVCGTGYERNSWIRLLSSSDIGKYFGLHSSSSPVELVPAAAKPIEDGNVSPVSDTYKPKVDWGFPSTQSSGTSTPLTSPSLSNSHILHNTKVYITRNYRLLPLEAGNEKTFKPKVYLQGCTESTHGLSESLLSILGVRSGLVVNDLFGDEAVAQ
ncbi:lysine/ornithine N-monooxygenase [Panus rudis PR-1116 ss-1]|nr:lysine/ornithine N-monooxygenase [Panus rudis PR-1116 ss-1]